MTERIKELALQAINFRLDPDSNNLEAHISPEDLEHFAELIISDICSIMNDRKSYNKCTYTTFDLEKAQCVAQELVKHINQHFGTKQ